MQLRQYQLQNCGASVLLTSARVMGPQLVGTAKIDNHKQNMLLVLSCLLPRVGHATNPPVVGMNGYAPCLSH